MDFSIIVCTYNPNPGMLARVLAALHAQDYAGSKEVILVDNNSTTPVEDLVLIKEYPTLRSVREKKQGLVYARLAGFNHSTGNTLVFADDDNVLHPGYLSALAEIITNHPETAVWGPGKIDLDYLKEPPLWIRKHFGAMYQEKNRVNTQSGKVAGWPDYYPAGSGMAVSRKVFEKYAALHSQGLLSATGRRGAELSSGEDAQIVWTAVKMGYAAGTSPSLRLTHIIPSSRLSLKYLTRLQFNLACSYCLSLAEMFPEKSGDLRPLSLPGHLRLAAEELVKSRFLPLLFARRYLVSRAWFSGVRAAARQRSRLRQARDDK